jgi:hypothetical protein
MVVHGVDHDGWVAITETVEEDGDVDGHGGDRILETETFTGHR